MLYSTLLTVVCATLAAEDLDHLKRYVYSGRGWKLLKTLDLVLLSYLLNTSQSDPPFSTEETKELTDLLISLYQVANNGRIPS